MYLLFVDFYVVGFKVDIFDVYYDCFGNVCFGVDEELC